MNTPNTAEYEPSWQFTHAITRLPSKSIIDGLRAQDTGTPDLAQMLKDHEAYVKVLRETGAEVIVLEALEDYPDSVFVEDTALCLPQGAVLMQPGALSRRGEVQQMAPALKQHYEQVLEITGDAYIEGGDILVTSKEILVGRSERTNAAGISQLAQLVKPWGHTVREVHTPPGVLHFKTDCSLLDSDTILATKRLSASGCFDDYNIIHTADSEEACANSIRYNEFVIMPDGFLKTEQVLIDAGFDVRKINNTECAKVDGGMSCLSLRF